MKFKKFVKSKELGHIALDAQADKSAALNRKRIGNRFRLAQSGTFRVVREIDG